MLKIKLARFGKRNQPHYRIVVNEARDKRDGSYVESLGHYGPVQKPKLLELDLERYQYWIGQGAQPTDTVAFLARVAKDGGKFPKKKDKPSKKKQAKKQRAEEAKDKKADKKVDKKAAKKEPAQKKNKQSDQKSDKDNKSDKDQESAKAEKSSDEKSVEDEEKTKKQV